MAGGQRHVATPTNPDARDAEGRRASTCAYCLRPVQRISILRGGRHPESGPVWQTVGGERRIEWRHMAQRKEGS